MGRQKKWVTGYWLRVTGYELRVARKGFTLVEILVATTILVIAMASIYVSFQGGVTAWAKGTARMEVYLNARAALDMMSREISSAMVNDWPVATGRRMDFLGLSGSGTNDQLFFMNPSPTGDLYKIEYWRNGSDLMRYYKVSTSVTFPPPTIANSDILIPDVTKLGFQYYKDSTSSPQNTWDSQVGAAEEGTLPEAVKITITVQDNQHRQTKQFSTIVYLPTSR